MYCDSFLHKQIQVGIVSFVLWGINSLLGQKLAGSKMTYNPVASSGLKLALENSLVSHNKFSLLGHVIFSKGIAPDDNMIRTIRDFKLF